MLVPLTTAALYLAFPLGSIPPNKPRLTGLGRFEHDHHVLDQAQRRQRR
jgi:hypothetical protein